jgi:hypothetical protein
MSKKRRADRTGRSIGESRYVQLPYWLMDTPAWRGLNPYARTGYIAVKRRYNGSNNGNIPLSVRELASDLNVGKTTAQDAFDDLEDRGFIRAQVKGHLLDIGDGRSTRWRLTEYDCHVTKDPPTKEFARWTGPPRPKRSHKKTQTVPPGGQSVPEGGHIVPEGGHCADQDGGIVLQGGHSTRKSARNRPPGGTVYKLPCGADAGPAVTFTQSPAMFFPAVDESAVFSSPDAPLSIKKLITRRQGERPTVLHLSPGAEQLIRTSAGHR